MNNVNAENRKWEDARLDLAIDFLEPPVLLKIDDAVICSLGNFSASTGKEKSKKTFNVSAIVAALLSGNKVLNYVPTLPKERSKILYVDTEQSPYHCKIVANRIIQLAGKELSDVEDVFIFLALRRYSTKERIEIIEQALEDNPDVFMVVIDGLRDLVQDINSTNESTDIMTKLLKWTDEKFIHIHCVLHLNKGDENTRGHLGTELNNKAESILQVTKLRENGNVSTVSPKSVRDREFETFPFQINEKRLPELVTDDSFRKNRNKRVDVLELDIEEHLVALNKVFLNNVGLGYGELLQELRKGYKDLFGVEFGEGKSKTLRKLLSDKGLIVQKERKYFLYPDYKS